jgi:hypothetical protein
MFRPKISDEVPSSSSGGDCNVDQHSEHKHGADREASPVLMLTYLIAAPEVAPKKSYADGNNGSLAVLAS